MRSGLRKSFIDDSEVKVSGKRDVYRFLNPLDTSHFKENLSDETSYLAESAPTYLSNIARGWSVARHEILVIPPSTRHTFLRSIKCTHRSFQCCQFRPPGYPSFGFYSNTCANTRIFRVLYEYINLRQLYFTSSTYEQLVAKVI